jgi:hypothetical protein
MTQATDVRSEGMQTIRVIKPKRACEILKEHGMAITEVKLDMGLRQRVFPFGDAIEMRSEWDYIIYENLLMKWIAERSDPT